MGPAKVPCLKRLFVKQRTALINFKILHSLWTETSKQEKIIIKKRIQSLQHFVFFSTWQNITRGRINIEEEEKKKKKRRENPTPLNPNIEIVPADGNYSLEMFKVYPIFSGLDI